MLLYSVQQSASFTGGAHDVAFAAVKVENDGGVAAKGVAVLVTFKTAQIRDLAVAPTAGSKQLAREVRPKSVALTFDTLLPKEAFTVNLVLSSPEKPSVSVRSEASLGIEGGLQNLPPSLGKRINNFLEILVPGTGVLMAVMGAFVLFRLRQSGFVEAFYSDRNNAGFLLLHHGLVDDATGDSG
jgi:hypothetical protein